MVEITQWTPEEEQRLRDQSSRLTQVEIREFVDRLAGRSNAEAFEALQLLYFRSDAFGDVYPYFDNFAELMESKNSYHRSRGLFLCPSMPNGMRRESWTGLLTAFCPTRSFRKLFPPDSASTPWPISFPASRSLRTPLGQS